MKTPKYILAFGAAALLSLAASPQLFAQGTPIVLSASVNSANNTVTILGADFGNQDPVVKFNGVTLPATYNKPLQTIVATLPGPQAPATYLLTVTRLNGNVDSFNLTIGAVGPQGPVGPIGATGPSGPQGRPHREAGRREGR